MDNSSRRGFFGQLFAGLTGCIFFPFFKKQNTSLFAFHIQKIKLPKPDKNDDIFLKSSIQSVKTIPITFTYCDLNGKTYSQHNGFAKMYFDKKNINGFQITYEKNLV